MRLKLALLAAKFTAFMLKVFGRLLHFNGTYFPGKVALKICPDFLKRVAKPKTVIAVTGTDGKTTTCNLLSDALEKCGMKVLNNRFGSNVYEGVVAAFLSGATLSNRCPYDIAVIEIDERSSHKIYPSLKPDYLVVTNLFRDSMKRNAHPEFIYNFIDKAMPEGCTLIQNADDSISMRLGEGHKKVYFGIDKLPSDHEAEFNIINDARICPKCHHKLSYDFVRYHHVGRVHCDHCGFKTPEPDYEVTRIDWEGGVMNVRHNGENTVYPLISDTIHNTYNELTVITMMSELGIEPEKIRETVGSLEVTKTRYNHIKVGDVDLVTSIAKGQNAVACSIVFNYVASKPGRKEILLLIEDHGDNQHSYENTAWLYDCDFEFLNNEKIERIVIGGKFSPDIALRLRLAGVPAEKIFTEIDPMETAKDLSYEKDKTVYLLYDIYQQVTTDAVVKKITEIAKAGQKGGSHGES
ncbi:MAG: DUF1727 domain-containing protein [Firmicutes bacterium]|nr:DUF1727 domain-containing protein [Bacillota bacterium]